MINLFQKIPGVVAFYSASDIPGQNTFNMDSFTYPVKEEVCTIEIVIDMLIILQ